MQFDVERSTLDVDVQLLPLQQRFAAIVEKVEAQKARMRGQLTELDTLFAALQQRPFKRGIVGIAYALVSLASYALNQKDGTS